jgi:hypothetical protein
LHTTPIKLIAINENEEINNKIVEKSLRSFNNVYKPIPNSILKNKDLTYEKVLNSIWISSKNESIYNLYSFSALNNFLSILKINFKISNFGLNIFCWTFILLILHRLDKKSFMMGNFYYFSLIILILIIYQTILTIWALHNNLYNEDGSLLISWSRHLGIIINGFFSYYFLNVLSNNSSNKIKFLLYCFLIFIIIFIPARIFRGIMPQVVENKIPFWENKHELRKNIQNLAHKIKNITGEDDFFLIVIENNLLDPYFYPILKYDLIKTNIIIINDDKLLKEKIKIINDSAQKYWILNYKDSSNVNKNFYKEKKINFELFELNKI